MFRYTALQTMQKVKAYLLSKRSKCVVVMSDPCRQNVCRSASLSLKRPHSGENSENRLSNGIVRSNVLSLFFSGHDVYETTFSSTFVFHQSQYTCAVYFRSNFIAHCLEKRCLYRCSWHLRSVGRTTTMMISRNSVRRSTHY